MKKAAWFSGREWDSTSMNQRMELKMKKVTHNTTNWPWQVLWVAINGFSPWRSQLSLSCQSHNNIWIMLKSTNLCSCSDFLTKKTMDFLLNQRKCESGTREFPWRVLMWCFDQKQRERRWGVRQTECIHDRVAAGFEKKKWLEFGTWNLEGKASIILM